MLSCVLMVCYLPAKQVSAKCYLEAILKLLCSALRPIRDASTSFFGAEPCAFVPVQDPLALVPWMQTLFALADAGMTTFDVSGRFFPFTNLHALFSSDNSTSYYEGTESVLGMFKRRCVVKFGCACACTCASFMHPSKSDKDTLFGLVRLNVA